MKVFKINKEKGKITRELISAMGHRIYQHEDIKGIKIKAIFKDGSEIGFFKDENKDDFEIMLEDGDKCQGEDN